MDTATLAATVIPAVISVLIALAIGAVGYLIAAFNEGRRWQRQQRITLYREITKKQQHIISEMYKHEEMEALHDKRFPEDSPDDAEGFEAYRKSSQNLIEQNRRVSKALSRTRDVVFELEIIGSRRVQDAFDNYVNCAVRWIKHLTGETPDNSSSLHRTQSWQTFIDEAQRDLGLKHWWNPRP